MRGKKKIELFRVAFFYNAPHAVAHFLFVCLLDRPRQGSFSPFVLLATKFIVLFSFVSTCHNRWRTRSDKLNAMPLSCFGRRMELFVAGRLFSFFSPWIRFFLSS